MKFLRFLKNPKVLLAISIFVLLSEISYSFLVPNPKRVLGNKTETVAQVESPSPKPTQSPAASPSASPAPKLSKSTYTIAVFGDSMVDTMGEKLDYLQKALSAKYPTTTFKLYNYGIGAQNIEQGLARWDQPFSYQTRNYPLITGINADVIILGSFAYNPFPPHDRNRHYLNLRELVKRANSQTASVYLLAEIAPLKTGFGNGPGGINWSTDLANTQSAHIVEQLENVINVSSSDNVKLINAYKQSQVDGKFGNPTYVSTHDGIHPSLEGHVLMANLITRTISLK